MLDGVPTALSERLTWDQEISARSLPGNLELVRNVTTPTLTPYLPRERTDRAVIVCPGGAFHFLAIEHEGRSAAEFVRDAGMAAFVLKYRLMPTPVDNAGFDRALIDAFGSGIENVGTSVVPHALEDARMAVELVRRDGYRHVTMLGFSAGARIASEVNLCRSDSTGPDAVVACYMPWILQGGATSDLPPLFVLAAADDELGVDGSFALTATWRAAGAPVDFHLFAQGGHGFGMNQTGHPVDQWPELLLAWHAALSI